MKKLLVFLFAVLASCGGERRVVIVSTNDIHSSVDNFPRLATLVDSLRGAFPGQVLLVDGGDRWTGDPFVDGAWEPLYPIVELMNELGYDIGVLGNHEFDWGQPLLRERTAQMKFPVLGANVEGLAGIEPFKIVRVDGLRLAFVGLVTNFNRFGRPEGKAEHFDGLTFPDVYRTAERYTSLRDSADVLVALTHIGFERDSVLAERVPAFDLVIGGDSHTVIERPVVVGRTLVTQTGSKLTYAGVTTITRRRGRTTIENHLVPLAEIEPDPRIAEMVARVKNDPALLAPLGVTARPFDARGMDNLVTDAIRAHTGAELTLYHSGGIRLDTLSGAVSTADVFRIEPFLSEIYTLRMTAGEVKGLIIGTFNSDDRRVAGRADLLPSGVSYVIETGVDGAATGVVLTPERASYTVALPDYLFKNYNFSFSGEMVETGIPVTDALRSFIEQSPTLVPENSARVEIR